MFIPPDGGYGWVVALASCMANIWTIGFLKSYSVLYLRIMNEFGDSAYRASWIHALLNMSGLLLCPVTGVLCVKFGSRRVAIAGGLLAFCGLLSSAFATSVSTLVFTLGLLVGVGVGWITTPGILIVNLYFDKRRTIACAICVSGSAIGGFFMPMLLEYLLSEYGLRGTLLISSALELQCVVAACLFRPTDIQARIQEQDRRRALRSVRKSSTSLAAAGTMSVPLTASLAGAASAMGCYGFGLGAYVVLAPAILAKYYGCEKLPATYGFTRLAMGFASFIAPQVNGETMCIFIASHEYL
ncbi:hypothetical protein HAZT_HAZT004618 [Hyalella azteca]|uniref:Major facilitator superfamily (MFS) profile domain-containing protein n=1 Tax=Hyalella azteca TaxID=294128 RepID=A0A6A0GX91_HYAAZ|nr:hypothetical protein HAZT_HAZT004618 [Hyalella azteca]